jgi:cytochrome c oxidase subunit 3
MAQTLLDTATSKGGGAEPIEPGFGDYGGGGEALRRIETAKLGLWVAMGSITMLFAAFTSAYIVRSAGRDWVRLDVPGILWINSAVLLLSSVTMEVARRHFQGWRPAAFRKWLLVTAVLGSLFLGGQLFAWQKLAAQGIYLSSHPHSSFFYVLTGVHGAHLLAGVLALFYVLALASRYRLTPGDSAAPALAATYWHFVDVLWLYLMVVLFYV